jgi:hypothetical protein
MFTILYHSLLIGAALFVPIPLLDERIAIYLWKRMVSELAKVHKRNLTREQILALSYSSRFSLSEGCLALLGQLLKAIFRTVFFFLEWRKAINLATDAYYSGYLLNELFSYEGFDPARSAQYAVAMQRAKQGVNTKLVQGVFRSHFRSSKGVFLSLGKWLSSITVGYARDSWARRRRKQSDGATDEQMENFFEMHRSRFQELLKDLMASVQTGIGALPKEHFEELRKRLFAEVQNLEATTN